MNKYSRPVTLTPHERWRLQRWLAIWRGFTERRDALLPDRPERAFRALRGRPVSPQEYLRLLETLDDWDAWHITPEERAQREEAEARGESPFSNDRGDHA